MESKETYKQFHEKFMQNNNGSTATETIIISLPAPFTIFIARVIILGMSSYLGVGLRVSKFSAFLIEFVCIIVPLTLCFTIFSDIVDIILLLTIVVSLTILLVNSMMVLRRLHVEEYVRTLLYLSITDKKRSFVTNFRAIVNLNTAVCILAVDFQIFPRRFAKTENYGYGGMDVGVGLFCIANAIVSKEALGCKERTTTALSSISNSFKSSFPLILLGMARFFTTQQIDYQQHTSEYGVHWNFFITLAVVKILCTIILTIINARHSLLASLVIITLHEIILCWGVRDWVLGSTPRVSWIAANREGIVSSWGYVAIYFAGIAMGQFMNRSKTTLKDNINFGTQLIVIASILWTCTYFGASTFGVSRRLANCGYFMWVLAYGVTLLFFFLLVELMISVHVTCLLFHSKKRSINLKESLIPIILNAISYNGLFYFLIANLLTGVINMCIHTLRQEAVPSIIIINSYMFVICSITVLLFIKDIKLKVW